MADYMMMPLPLTWAFDSSGINRDDVCCGRQFIINGIYGKVKKLRPIREIKRDISCLWIGGIIVGAGLLPCYIA